MAEKRRGGEPVPSLPRAPPGLAAELRARGLRRRRLEESGRSAPRAAPRSPASSTVPPPAHGCRGRLVPAQAILPSSGSADPASAPQYSRAREQHPQGAAPPLTCSSASPGVPRRVFANLKLSFCNVAAQRPFSFAHSTSEPKDFDRKLFLSYSVSFPVPFYQGQSGGKCGHRPPSSLSVPSATEGASLRRFPRIVRTGEAHFPVEQTSQIRRPEWTWQSATAPPPPPKQTCFLTNTKQGSRFKWHLLLNIRHDFTAFRGIPTPFSSPLFPSTPTGGVKSLDWSRCEVRASQGAAGRIVVGSAGAAWAAGSGTHTGPGAGRGQREGGAR